MPILVGEFFFVQGVASAPPFVVEFAPFFVLVPYRVSIYTKQNQPKWADFVFLLLCLEPDSNR